MTKTEIIKSIEALTYLLSILIRSNTSDNKLKLYIEDKLHSLISKL